MVTLILNIQIGALKLQMAIRKHTENLESHGLRKLIKIMRNFVTGETFIPRGKFRCVTLLGYSSPVEKKNNFT